MELKVTTDQLDDVLHKLERTRRKAVPYAIRDSLNASAFLGRREWAGQYERGVTIRNTWTQRGILVERATGNDISRMYSVVGNVRPYAGQLETGGTVSDPRGVPIHTSVASGEGMGKRPRKKPVRPTNRLNRIERQVGTWGNRRQRNAQAVRRAARASGTGKVAFLDLGKTKGLFRVSGSTSKPRIKLIISVGLLSTRAKPHPTLAPTLVALQPKLPTLHALAIVRQLRRHRVIT